MLSLRTPKPNEPAGREAFNKRGALVSFWLLSEQHENETFSINTIARTLQLGPATVHRVIQQLVYEGWVKTEGFRTLKRFRLTDPRSLLIAWLKDYQILRRSKVLRLAGKPVSLHQGMSSGLLPALHNAAKGLFEVSATNLQTSEYYLLNWEKRMSLAQKLNWSEMDRGYEILLLRPYYETVVANRLHDDESRFHHDAYILLTFLDLFHYPLRGREQAEVLFRRLPLFRKFGTWSSVERAL